MTGPHEPLSVDRPPAAGHPELAPTPDTTTIEGPEFSGTAVWYERRATRVTSAVIIVIGVLLMGVGALGFVSAAATNNDSQATKDQVATLEQETSALQEDRDAREAEAETAATATRKLTADIQTVRFAVLNLHNVTHDAVAAGNALSDCDSISDNTAFIGCTNSALQGYENAITTELNAVAETRKVIATLEEDLRA